MAAKQTSAVALNFPMGMRRLEIEIALREHAERGGQIFKAEADVNDKGVPCVTLKMAASAASDAIFHVAEQRGLTPLGPVTWGVDAEGIHCEIDVKPKERKPRGPNKAKAPPVAPAAGG